MSLQRFVYAPETWQQNLINSTLSWSAKHSNFTPWIAQTYAELAQVGIDFMAERISEYDFLPINLIEDTYSKILFLKTNPEFYSNMLKRCYERSKTSDSESIRNKWLKVFEEAAIFSSDWSKVPEWQKKTAFLLKRYLLKQERLYSKIRGEV